MSEPAQREIVLDTETTGLDPNTGDRIVEIGCVELENHVPTGKTRQWYLNPDRDMPDGALKIHGLTAEFLSNKPRFSDIAVAFLEFIGESPLIIHNAEFDMKFLNAELRRVKLPALIIGRAIDTLVMARRKFPGSQASLDALCKRFNINNTGRTLHGALLDSELLAEVYLQLLGGREPGFVLSVTVASSVTQALASRQALSARPHFPSEVEDQAHQAFLRQLKDPVWNS